MTTLALINIYFVAAIPMAFLILFLMRMVGRRRMNRSLTNKMWLFWGLNLIALAFFGGSMFKQFNYKGQVSEIIVQDLDVDNLHIKHRDTDFDEILMSLGDLKISDESLLSDEIRLKVAPSDNDNFNILKNKTSRGHTRKYAHQLARDIENFAEVEGDLFEFEEVIKIPQGEKWRNQQVAIEVQVPIGKTIEFDNRQRRFYIHTDEGYISGSRLTGKQFVMTENGLVCQNCETKEKD